jgi:hypothetical protein
VPSTSAICATVIRNRRSEQQVEVGEHRGPSGSAVTERTVDFDPLRNVPCEPRTSDRAVEPII